MPARNDPCPCGSGKKFKQCCLRRPAAAAPAAEGFTAAEHSELMQRLAEEGAAKKPCLRCGLPSDGPMAFFPRPEDRHLHQGRKYRIYSLCRLCYDRPDRVDWIRAHLTGVHGSTGGKLPLSLVFPLPESPDV